MLGIWEDGHIDQFKRIAQACKEEKALSLVQIVHGGFQSSGQEVYSASTYEKANKTVLPMTLEHIKSVKKEFVEASVRAYKAGLDGVEVHGAHTYLLNQFTSKKTNQREDYYGGSLENRCRLPLEIVKEIRQATSPEFIIGYRFGCNDESFEEDIVLLKALDEAGVDFFNVSAGFITSVIDMPKNFPYSYITYLGVHLKNYTKKPVACVYNIRTEITARDLIQNFNVPMIAAGRAILADPYWAFRVLEGKTIDECYHCKPRCHYGSDGRNCPYFKEEWLK
jgi:2,4-dienoyl-CoA reductase-like NADH-dependent reductase (Old Yellow Enzyme family)